MTKAYHDNYLIAFVLLLCTPAIARADLLENIGGNMGISSKYIVNGIAYSDTPIFHFSAQYKWDNSFQTGIWSTQSEYLGSRKSSKNSTEINYFASYSAPLNPNWQTDITLTHYEYHGHKIFHTYDYDEMILAFDYDEIISMSVGIAKNLFRQEDLNLNYELIARQALPLRSILSIGIGYNKSDKNVDVNFGYWNVNITKQISTWLLDAGYYLADKDAGRYYGKQRTDGQVAISVSLLF